jgi:hypothetical protein
MRDSEVHPKDALADQLRILWQHGRGRGGVIPKDPLHAADVEWNRNEFIRAMEKLGAKIADVTTVESWFSTVKARSPGKNNWRHIRKVFFPKADSRGEPDAGDAKELDALWSKAFSNPAPTARKSAVPRGTNYPDDWQLTGWHDFEGLVDLTTYHPERDKYDMKDQFTVPGKLKFGTVSREDNGIRVELSVRAGAACLKIPKGSYHCLPDSMIGEANNKNDNFTPGVGGVAVIAPQKNGLLNSDGKESGIVIASVVQVREGGVLQIRLTAPLTGIEATGQRIENGVAREIRPDESALLKLLLKRKGVRQDAGTGEVILAEQRWTKKTPK